MPTDQGDKAMPAYGYPADDLRILTALEAIRQRPRLYVPDLSASGLHALAGQLVRAAVVPEGHNGCSRLRLVVGRGGSWLTLVDDGRGLPVGPVASRGGPRPALEVALTEPFVGGHHPSDASPAVYGYLAGMGAYANALCREFRVTTHRDGVRYRCRCERGVVVEPVRGDGPADRRGTVVRLRPDPALWDGEPCFSAARLQEAVRPLASEHPGVAITLVDEETGSRTRLP